MGVDLPARIIGTVAVSGDPAVPGSANRTVFDLQDLIENALSREG